MSVCQPANGFYHGATAWPLVSLVAEEGSHWVEGVVRHGTVTFICVLCSHPALKALGALC